jgi:hypothetical protein
MTYLSHKTRENTVEMSVSNAKGTIGQFKKLRAYYTENIVKKVKGQTDLKISYDHKENANTIPLPATMVQDLSELIGQDKEGIQLKLYSAYPFPNRKGRVLDDFAKAATLFLQTHPSETFVKTELLSGREVVRAIADTLVVEPASTVTTAIRNLRKPTGNSTMSAEFWKSLRPCSAKSRPTANWMRTWRGFPYSP